MSFSPDSQWIAFSAPDDTAQVQHDERPRLSPHGRGSRAAVPEARRARSTATPASRFWSKDGETIYFNEGIRATNQLMALDVKTGAVKQLTEEKASLSVDRDDDTGVLLITYSDADDAADDLHRRRASTRSADRTAWKQLTDPNPQVKTFALGEQEEITWKSKDGTMVGGVLVKPVGYRPGQRYPLIVAIHGGPAAADVLGFNGGYGSQVYAGAGYAVLRPNYRGSTNYGQKHKTDIVGNYFAPGYDDIMTGVDYLIAQGIVDGDEMGALGWSAGGHWSNWILTHTDRFKAISTGAGTSNWISMYAQSDVQRNRQFYLGDKLPYDDFDAYWNQSPIKYIKNAKTPTMIHVVDGDPRVPSPQSMELHMALKQLGVPTEFFMYPGRDARHPRSAQPAREVGERDGVDGLLRARPGQEVRVARRAEDARGRRPEAEDRHRDGHRALTGDEMTNSRSMGYWPRRYGRGSRLRPISIPPTAWPRFDARRSGPRPTWPAFDFKAGDGAFAPGARRDLRPRREELRRQDSQVRLCAGAGR